MVEIRLAKKGEEVSQKEIWKLCFGDETSYIDFYFSHKYKKEGTALLLDNGKIAAMTTMILTKIVSPNGSSLESAMLYAVATHPEYQGRGYSTQIMEFCQNYLEEKGICLSILVPASQSLFDFYAKRGYEKSFYNREVTLTDDQILAFKIDISTQVSTKVLEAKEYNERRRSLLRGNFYVDYSNDEVEYQKKVSKRSGADLYAISIGSINGCAIIEHINEGKLLIKEILMPEGVIKEALHEIAQLFPAKEHTIRLPAYVGQGLGGKVQPFGMIKSSSGILREIIGEDAEKQLAYIGIAHD